jgi:hypothetical protein
MLKIGLRYGFFMGEPQVQCGLMASADPVAAGTSFSQRQSGLEQM